MLRSPFDCTTIAAQLDAARLERRPIAPPPRLGFLSLVEAYDIQDALVARRDFAGCGWKLGLTSRVKQRRMNIDQPLFGRISSYGSMENEGSVTCAAFIAPRVEPELAFGLAAPLDSDAAAASLLGAVAWIAPALEITDSRYLGGTRTAVELVADNTSSAAYVLGARVLLGAAPQLDAIETALVRNGEVMAAGRTADVLGNPVAALGLLAAHLAQRGLRTTAGDVILSGAITDAFPAASGDRFEARFGGLTTVAVRFV